MTPGGVQTVLPHIITSCNGFVFYANHMDCSSMEVYYNTLLIGYWITGFDRFGDITHFLFLNQEL